MNLSNITKLSFLLIAFIFCLNSESKAQGNLQFNEVKIISLPTGNTTITVPAGKVWKVINSSNNNVQVVSINGVALSLIMPNNYNNSSPNNPIWLQGGMVVGFGYNASSTAYAINIIEFNIVP